MYVEDKHHVDGVITMIADENKQKELLMEDEEEDFLDECKSILQYHLIKCTITGTFKGNLGP